MAPHALKILHVIGGRSGSGGTMSFARGLVSHPTPGIEEQLWKHHTFPAIDSLPYLREGRARETDLSLAGDLLGGWRDGWALARSIRRHRFDVLHAHSRLGMVASAIAGRLTGRPVIMHMHFTNARVQIYRRLWRGARAEVLFNSKRTALHYGVEPTALNVVEPFIDWPERAQEQSSQEPAYVMAGVFVPLKNIHRVLDAYEALPAAVPIRRVVLHGMLEQPPAPAYQAEILRRASTNASIEVRPFSAGWLKELNGNQVFVHAATVESFGIVILEALARGCRLVVPEGTFLDDLAEPYRSRGIYRSASVEPRDLAAAMQSAAGERLAAGELGMLRAGLAGSYSVAQRKATLAALYRRLASGSQRPHA